MKLLLTVLFSNAIVKHTIEIKKRLHIGNKITVSPFAILLTIEEKCNGLILIKRIIICMYWFGILCFSFYSGKTFLFIRL